MHHKNLKKRRLLFATITSAALLGGCGSGDEDDDGKDKGTVIPMASIEETSALEGNSGNNLVEFRVSLSERPTEDVSVDYELIEGTATADVDYNNKSGTVTIKSGSRNGVIELEVIGDTIYEKEEWFEVRIRNAKNAKIDRRTRKARVIIRDDEEKPTVYFSTPEQTASEVSGSVAISMLMNNVSAFDTEIQLSVTGTAQQGEDYELPDTLKATIPRGEQSYSIPVEIIEDNIPEGGETIIFNFDRLSNAIQPTVRSGQSDRSTLIIAGDVVLNDTGVTTFSDGAGLHGVSSEPSSAPMQDGSVGRDVRNKNSADGQAGFSFTKLDIHGNPLVASAPAWACVRDNTTGLVWEEKTLEATPPDISNWRAQNYSYTWYEAVEAINGGSVGAPNDRPRMDASEPVGDFCAYKPSQQRRHKIACNSNSYINEMNFQGLCGFNDWRMPEVDELRSIYAYSSSTKKSMPDPSFFKNTESVTGKAYWTATPAADNKASSWCLDAQAGDVRLCKKNSGQQIRAVRSAQGVSK